MKPCLWGTPPGVIRHKLAALPSAPTCGGRARWAAIAEAEVELHLNSAREEDVAAKQQMSGMRGVYLAAAELTRRGFIVSPTTRSAAGADLLITDDTCRKAYSIQVKTITGGSKYWLLNAHAKTTASDSHLYVFVDICDARGSAEFFIVPSKKVAKHHYVNRQPGGNVWYVISREDVEKHHVDLKIRRRTRKTN